jgi:hypothetical protein
MHRGLPLLVGLKSGMLVLLSSELWFGACCDSSCTCKLGTLFVSVKYVLVSVKLMCVYVKFLKI